MYISNTDLLPPLFDRVLAYFDVERSGALLREDIVKGLENGIVNAAAAHARAQADRPVQPGSPAAVGSGMAWAMGKPAVAPGTSMTLTTSDRLSGADISRAALVQQLQAHTDLDAALLEIGLLLVEAQIDLRLKGGGAFKISGIEFSRPHTERPGTEPPIDIAMWCRSVLAPALQSATDDKPSVWTAFGKRRPAGIRVLVDSLQLNATLRDAVPYDIRVDRHLVEPLLAEPRSDQRIRLLHISDLHLAADLSEPGRKLARPVLAPTHSFETARFVASAVSALQPRYDAVVATGDLTTDGARESFETVLQYVQSGSITGANPMRIAAYGLNASRSQRILLPGNHDRYAGATITGQRLDLTCEDVLGTPREYPYLLGYRPHGREADSLTLLFLVFDSSLQAGRGSGLSPADWKRALAKGEIRDAELLQARKLVESKAAQPRVERIGGGFIDFDPGKTLRIALLHHHPVTKYARPAPPGDRSTLLGWMKEKFVKPVQDFQGEQVAESMAMENSDAFLRCCFDCGMQLILFGHQHYPYQRLVLDKGAPVAASPFGPGTGHMRAFCCPTTLQYDAPANGFYVFDFESETHIEWAMYGNFRVEGRPAAPMKLLQRKSFDLSAAPSAEEFEESYALGH